MTRLPVYVLALLVPWSVFGEESRDTQEINRYVLTEATLSKYASAVEMLRPLASQVASCEETEGVESIRAMVTRLDRNPAIKGAIESAGLTTREYVLFSLGVFQAGMAAWALDQPGGTLPPGFQRKNVDFYNAHKAAIEGVKPLDESACDEYAEEQEPIEE
ncbi:MAG TPA: hypothetical protein VFR29_00895 [Steroidobacteraceae bacterium]|nr:hypothetical protein [Steroidobacteraceae bacterium]